jgi:uridine kinase
MAAARLVVAVIGPSSSGKTSVCAELLASRPWAVVVHQDDFYKPIEEIPKLASGAADWDCPDGIDWARMHEKIAEAAKEKPVVLVEGHMLSLRDDAKFDLAFFIDTTKEVCGQRRAARSYEYEEPADYFEVAVWPCAERTRLAATKLSGCQFLDGVSISAMAQTIAQAVESHSSFPSLLF